MKIVGVRRFAAPTAVELLGPDKQGRPTYQCPAAGCEGIGYLDDGVGHCPECEQLAEWVRAMSNELEQQLGVDDA